MGIRVLLAEDHQIVREGLRAILSKHPDIEVVGEAQNGRTALDEVGRLKPDVVLMDISMPELNGFEATLAIRRDHPSAKVIALSAHADKQHAAVMLRSGASGYVCKDSAGEELVTAIRTVHSGQRHLSPQVAGAVGEIDGRDAGGRDGSAFSKLGARERQVVQLLAEGCSSKEIASRLCIAVRTVESHRRNVMQKLMLHSVAELTKYAVREGLTSLEH